MIKLKNIKEFILEESQIGNVSATVKKAFVAPFYGYVSAIRMRVKTAGTTGSQIGDVLIDATSVFTTAGNKPTLTTGTDTGWVQGATLIDGTRRFIPGQIITLSVPTVHTTPAVDCSLIAILVQDRIAGALDFAP